MAYCINCGREIDQSSTFCPICGVSQAGGSHPVGGSPGRPSQPMERGFFASIFDFSLKSLMGRRLVSASFIFLFVLVVVVCAVYLIIGIVALPYTDPVAFIGILVAVAVFFFMYLFLIRLFMEVSTAIFSILEEIRDIKKKHLQD